MATKKKAPAGETAARAATEGGSGEAGVIGEVLDIPAAPVRIMIFDVANTDFGMEGKTARAMGR